MTATVVASQPCQFLGLGQYRGPHRGVCADLGIQEGQHAAHRIRDRAAGHGDQVVLPWVGDRCADPPQVQHPSCW